MSRRHRGRPHHHAPAATDAPRRNAGVEPAASTAPDSPVARAAAAAPTRAPGVVGPAPVPVSPAPQHDEAGPSERLALDDRDPIARPAPADGRAAGNGAEHHQPFDASQGRPVSVPNGQPPVNGDRSGQCTAPQLRRFIKSRPYVPMHELRRRFSINGDDDDVTPVRIDPGWIYVGLPNHEGRLLGDLLRTGEIGYELSLDPRTPIVVGVYPMRPIPRP
jgi:hypothetical protein